MQYPDFTKSFIVTSNASNYALGGVLHFSPYLYGRKFTLVTDRRPLVWLHSLKDPASRLARWRIKLSKFEYDIAYKPERVNSNADTLSRNSS